MLRRTLLAAAALTGLSVLGGADRPAEAAARPAVATEAVGTPAPAVQNVYYYYDRYHRRHWRPYRRPPPRYHHRPYPYRPYH